MSTVKSLVMKFTEFGSFYKGSNGSEATAAGTTPASTAKAERPPSRLHSSTASFKVKGSHVV